MFHLIGVMTLTITAACRALDPRKATPGAGALAAGGLLLLGLTIATVFSLALSSH